VREGECRGCRPGDNVRVVPSLYALTLTFRRPDDLAQRTRSLEVDLLRENASLHERIATLQGLLADVQAQRSPFQPISVTDLDHEASGAPQDQERLADYENAEEIMDGWQRGVLQARHREVTARNSPFVDSSSNLPFPSREESTRVVSFALQLLGWIHCALRADDFMLRHERFWDDATPPSHSPASPADNRWLMLYFSVLTVCAV
jgi:hypothetical protein